MAKGKQVNPVLCERGFATTKDIAEAIGWRRQRVLDAYKRGDVTGTLSFGVAYVAVESMRAYLKLVAPELLKAFNQGIKRTERDHVQKVL